VLELQLGVAWLVLQGMPHPPQCATDVRVSTQPPVPQSVRLPGHVAEQAVPSQSGVDPPQTVVQSPHVLGSKRSVSQPSVGSALQSR
jgi:hypothetical protein